LPITRPYNYHIIFLNITIYRELTSYILLTWLVITFFLALFLLNFVCIYHHSSSPVHSTKQGLQLHKFSRSNAKPAAFRRKQSATLCQNGLHRIQVDIINFSEALLLSEYSSLKRIFKRHFYAFLNSIIYSANRSLHEFTFI
jgi:hypothetical protein